MIYETFSKRNKRIASAGKPEVYQYDNLPEPFRVQVVHVWHDSLGGFYIPRGYSHGRHPLASNRFWATIHKTTSREAGLPCLGKAGEELDERCVHYLMEAQTDDALNIIEISCRVIDQHVRRAWNDLPNECGVIQEPDDAIEEINHRFKEHGIGYQYANGMLFKIDSQFLHAEAVKPALTLLNAKGFEGPAQEFMAAFDHFRHGRNKEASDAALKSFESTMKTICAKRKWTYDSKATAKQLLETLIKNGLIPASMESH